MLDQSKLAPFLNKHFADTRHERLVGPTRQYDSGYIDIIRFFGGQAVDIHGVMGYLGIAGEHILIGFLGVGSADNQDCYSPDKEDISRSAHRLIHNLGGSDLWDEVLAMQELGCLE